MRKITSKAIESFLSATPFSGNNTKVIVSKQGLELRLHNNLIAQFTPECGLYITTAGWDTNTTKERLNGLPGVRINKSKGKLFLNGIEWDGRMTKVRQGLLRN